MNKYLSGFSSRFPAGVVYMLQSVEYSPEPYLAWLWRFPDFNKITYRRMLTYTRAAKLLLYTLWIGVVLQLSLGVALAVLGLLQSDFAQVIVGVLIIVTYPIIWGHLITIPLVLGRILLVKPKEKRLVNKSANIFEDHKAVTIAVAGSYGKTTVKELLLTILSQGKNVAATPANKNVAVSHAKFASKLSGQEEVLVIEYGEGQPGDVAKFAQTTKPQIGIVTGLAPAHLDKYKTLDAAAKDIMSLADYVDHKNLYINSDSPELAKYIKADFHKYSTQEVGGWKVKDVNVSVNGMDFVMQNGKRRLKLSTKLVGKHLIGPLAVCVDLADQLGLTDDQIQAGVAKTEPFEHRMQPRMLAGGWIIDDTYNGNLEGIRAGLELLNDLDAKRKIYVTPGLVDQGKESERVHNQVGKLIAKANPTKIVLMNNSATKWIQAGLGDGNYTGEVVIEDDPLNFYSNLDQFIAVGDVVLMQNDWTDNYN